MLCACQPDLGWFIKRQRSKVAKSTASGGEPAWVQIPFSVALGMLLPYMLSVSTSIKWDDDNSDYNRSFSTVPSTW